MDVITKKVAIVTGATAGIGLATAKILTKKGWTVYGTGRRNFDSDDFRYVCLDVNDSDGMKNFLQTVFDEHGRIDLVVNNAGFGIAGAIEDATVENIKAITDTNLVAVAVTCKHAIPFLKPTKGKIINVSSIGGLIPLPYQAMYSATKSAVEVFSRALATEVKPFGMTVTAVLPGDTKTDFGKARVTDSNPDSGNQQKMQRFVGKMERDENNGVSPDVVAKAICKAAEKKRSPLRVCIGFGGKTIAFLTRFLSVKTINSTVNKIYK